MAVSTPELKTEDGIKVCLLPQEGFLPKKFKVCAEVEVPGQKPIESLTDNDRFELGGKVAQIISANCLKLGPISMTVDGVKEGFINVGVYTNELLDINALRDAEGIYPLFAYDISNIDEPKQLESKHWMKK